MRYQILPGAVLIACTAGTGLSGCGGQAAKGAPPREPEPVAKTSELSRAGVEIAKVRGPSIDVFKERGAARPWKRLPSPNRHGAQRVFLVERNAGEWLKVSLPIRPNGSSGWIKATAVDLRRTAYRLEVDRRSFRFAVFSGDRKVRTGKIAVGTRDTPSPSGRFYVTEVLRPQDPAGVYGAYAFGLSGFSPRLKSFGGGPGQLAVHGTNDPASLGGRVSHGCVRVANDDITWMAKKLATGTPVVIR